MASAWSVRARKWLKERNRTRGCTEHEQSATKLNNASCHLLALAPELRSAIWELAIGHQRVILPDLKQSLLQTCRQIRNEARPIFLATCTLTLLPDLQHILRIHAMSPLRLRLGVFAEKHEHEALLRRICHGPTAHELLDTYLHEIKDEELLAKPGRVKIQQRFHPLAYLSMERFRRNLHPDGLDERLIDEVYLDVVLEFEGWFPLGHLRNEETHFHDRRTVQIPFIRTNGTLGITTDWKYQVSGLRAELEGCIVHATFGVTRRRRGGNANSQGRELHSRWLHRVIPFVNRLVAGGRTNVEDWTELLAVMREGFFESRFPTVDAERVVHELQHVVWKEFELFASDQ